MGVQNGTATWEGSLAISYKITHTLTLCRSVTKSRPTPHDPTDCSKPGPLSSTLSQSLLKFMSTESVMLSNHLILCLLLLLCFQSSPSIRVFSLLLHELAVTVLGIYPKKLKVYVRTKTCIRVFTAALNK